MDNGHKNINTAAKKKTFTSHSHFNLCQALSDSGVLRLFVSPGRSPGSVEPQMSAASCPVYFQIKGLKLEPILTPSASHEAIYWTSSSGVDKWPMYYFHTHALRPLWQASEATGKW